MKFLRFYFPNTPYKFVYMLQQLEYEPKKMWVWLTGFPDLKTTIKRGKLILTTKAKVLLILAYGSYLMMSIGGLWLITNGSVIQGLIMLLLAIDATVVVLLGVSIVGSYLLAVKRAPLMRRAKDIFHNHPAIRIAVLGSYGKTTMKELLHTVLSEKFYVEMTPGNKNVPISHARWAPTLSGDEDVLVVEYGEGEPGDISALASLSSPTMAVMTGVAPNHLDHYKTLDALEADLAQIEAFVSGEALYVNADAVSVISRLKHHARLYSSKEVNGWNIFNVSVAITGVSFTMKRGPVSMKLKSKLLGEHNVGPLAAVASIAYDLGLSTAEIESGIAKTAAFEHRMQARQLYGAWLIDDTYNGNLEGFRAGLKLLGQLDAKRKIYVTPGLVDQGEESERVHAEIGQAIAVAKPDKVILMRNANTEYIERGMADNGFTGELVIETDPLGFYNGIEQFVAAGDLVLMQNDFPDAYA